MTLSRRTLAAARRRMREDPGSVAEIVIALVLSELEDGDDDALTAEQAVALTWYWRACGEAEA